MYSLKKIPVVVTADATTGGVTGSKVYVGMSRITAILIRYGGHTSGNTIFTWKASLDDEDGKTTPTMTNYNMVIDNLTNTSAQTPTRIQTKTISANGDYLLWLDPNSPVNYLETDYNTTTDGTVQIWYYVQQVD